MRFAEESMKAQLLYLPLWRGKCVIQRKKKEERRDYLC